jgi:predicted nucleotidyltransferase
VVNAVHPEVSALVADIHARVGLLMSQNLVGLYVFGSVASDAYDPGVSDVDILVVSAQPLVAEDYARLGRMHVELAAGRKQWEDRIEVEYVSREALRTVKKRTSDIGVIGPGKPFQVIKAGRDWLLEWHDVRENAIVVAGPDPRTLIDPITWEELNACVRDYVQLFPGPVRDNPPRRGSDAYAVLTMCRALYLNLIGETTTKRAAAEWAAREYPQWRDLIVQAQQWRLAADNEAMNSAEIHAQGEAFVNFTVHTLH